MRITLSIASLFLAAVFALQAVGQDEPSSSEHPTAVQAESDGDAGTPSQPDGGVTDAQEESETVVPPPSKAEIPQTKDADKKKPHTDADEKGKKVATLNWRRDPKVLRHPGSYIGLALGYGNSHAWFTTQEKEFEEDLAMGPLHGWQLCFRTGDAFTEWFAVGFQIDFGSGGFGSPDTIGTFGLLLDTTFYPWQGLGIRPSVGLGFSYVQGEKEFEFGFGGPGSLSLALTYEFRIARLATIGPVAQAYWIAGEDFNGLYFFIGVEFLKWFDTPTG